MNKAELIDAIAARTGTTKTATGQALAAVIDAIAEALCRGEGEAVALIGCGAFHVKERAERRGRNPKTGEAMTIPAQHVVTFKSGRTLKDEVNASA